MSKYKQFDDPYAICPCYHEDRKQKIVCDGVIGQATISSFRSDKEKKEWKDDFCRDFAYKGCPIYQLCCEEATLQK